MAIPKISAFLHNCAMHIGVPELLEGIQYFSDEKHLANPALDAHKADYEKLKKLFSEFYTLPDLSWEHFFELLTTKVNHNSIAAQMMLGPVLRVLLSEKTTDKSLSEIQSSGKYSFLTCAQAQTVYQDFGIKFISYEKMPSKKDFKEVDSVGDYYPPKDEFKVSNQVAVVNVYNEGSHWERVPESKISTVKDDRPHLGKNSPWIFEARILQSLTALKMAVKNVFMNVSMKKKEVSVPKTVEAKVEEIIDANAKRAASEYSKSRVKPSSIDIKAKEDNVRQLMRDLFKVNYDVKPLPVKLVGELEKDFKKREQFARDEALARKLQAKEIEKVRGMRF